MSHNALSTQYPTRHIATGRLSPTKYDNKTSAELVIVTHSPRTKGENEVVPVDPNAEAAADLEHALRTPSR